MKKDVNANLVRSNDSSRTEVFNYRVLKCGDGANHTTKQKRFQISETIIKLFLKKHTVGSLYTDSESETSVKHVDSIFNDNNIRQSKKDEVGMALEIIASPKGVHGTFKPRSKQPFVLSDTEIKHNIAVVVGKDNNHEAFTGCITITEAGNRETQQLTDKIRSQNWPKAGYSEVDSLASEDSFMLQMSKTKSWKYNRISNRRSSPILCCRVENGCETEKLAKWKSSGCVITNTEVLGELLHYVFKDLAWKGVFPPHSKNVNKVDRYPVMVPPMTPIPVYPHYRNESFEANRLSNLYTFRSWPNESPVSADDLVAAGFQRMDAESMEVGCLSCGLRLNVDDFITSDALSLHRQRSPTCPSLPVRTVTDPDTQDRSRANGIEMDGGINQLSVPASPESGNDGIGRNLEQTTPPLSDLNNGDVNTPRGAEAAPTNTPEAYAPRNPAMASSSARRQSYVNWSGRRQDIDVLVNAGFFFTGDGDIVRCFHCDIGLAEWDPNDDPWVEHARHSPDCPFLQQQKDKEFVTIIQTQWSKIYTPKHPHLCDTPSRIKTFTSLWPRNYVLQTPEQLAEAGFFYTGETDTVRCHYCDGGLREWEPEDNPWVEHAKWFPFCKFVIRVKGISFVRASAPPEIDDAEPNTPAPASKPAYVQTPSFVEQCRRKELENPLFSAAAQSVRDIGYRKRDIKSAINLYITHTGKRDFSASDLMTAIFELEEKGLSNSVEEDGISSGESGDEFTLTPKAMEMENRYLKKNLLCMVCKDKESCILFLDCGHRVTCETCAKQQKQCIVCKSEVKSSIKTFLG